MSIYAYIGIIIIVIAIGICTIIIHEKGNKLLAVMFLVVTFIGEVFIIYDINNTPTALDVYEGKIPVDTIVIYKKEK